MTPDWLPSELTLNGTIDEDYAQLYAVFQQELASSDLEIEDVPIIIDLHPDRSMPKFPAGFMHMITRDDGTGVRTIDYARATKLCWVSAIIRYYKEPEVYAFWRQGPRVESLYLWLEGLDYVVILKWTNRHKQKHIIVTAHSVDPHRRRDYQRYYAEATRIL